jgi:hypothetical protein
MKVTYIDNEPKYKVGDVLVTSLFKVFKVVKIVKSDIDEWQRKAYEIPSRFGSFGLTTEDDAPRECGKFRYQYVGEEISVYETSVLGDWIDGFTKAIERLSKERDEYKQALEKVYDAVSPWY